MVRILSGLTAAGMFLVLNLRLAATAMPRVFSGREFALAVVALMVGVALLFLAFFVRLSREEGILGTPAMRRLSQLAALGAGLLVVARLSQFVSVLALQTVAKNPLFEMAEALAFAGAFFFCRGLAKTAVQHSWMIVTRVAEVGKWSFGVLMIFSLGLAYNSATGGSLLGILMGKPIAALVFYFISLLFYLGVIFFFIGFAWGLKAEISRGIPIETGFGDGQ